MAIGVEGATRFLLDQALNFPCLFFSASNRGRTGVTERQEGRLTAVIRTRHPCFPLGCTGGGAPCRLAGDLQAIERKAINTPTTSR